METNTLGTRASTILGPYSSDMMLSIKKIGSSDEGLVHPLCAPVIYDYTYTQKKLLEVCSLPNAFLMKRNKMYLMSAFIGSVEYSLSKI
jgi:hypothetical protein